MITLLAIAGIVIYLIGNGRAKVEVVANTPAPATMEEITPPGVTHAQTAAIQSAVSAHVPEFDAATSRPLEHTMTEAKAMAQLALARANATDNRLVLIGTPDMQKFVDAKGVTMFRLQFSVYDAVDNAGSRLEAEVLRAPAGDLGTSIAHFRHAFAGKEDATVSAAEDGVGRSEQAAEYEAPWDYARRFVLPSDDTEDNAPTDGLLGRK